MKISTGLKIIPFFLSFMAALSCSSLSLQQSGDNSNIVSTAKRYLGVPYEFGGNTPKGFDCSGFVQFVYGKNGLSVPRTTEDQFKKGKKIRFSDALPGDLLFFKTGTSPVSHVVIYCGKMKFIHAPRTGKTVSIDSLTISYWKKRYRGTVTYRNTASSDEFREKDIIPDNKKKDDKDFDYVVFNNKNQFKNASL